jgi:plastocyanin domain-containing protein
MGKNTWMIATILLLIIGFSWIVYNYGNNNSESGVVVNAQDEGEYQKIVIGMKNYNYYPNTITVNAGKAVRIYLDGSVGGCFRDFTIREFGIQEYLITPEDYVEFTPDKRGTYTFACSMGMGSGKLIVE